MFKVKWILKYLISLNTYKQISKKIEKPSNYYWQVFLKLINDKSSLVVFNLDTGRQFYAYRFMDLFKFYEIFIGDDYGAEIEHAKHIVDIGGNKGYFSLRLHEQFPNATFHCYEPEPTNFESLEKQLNENSVDFIAYQEGVSAENGELNLYINRKNDGGHSLYQVAEEGESIPVKIVSIEKVMNRLPKDSIIDILKLDCEGAEKEIILRLTPKDASRIQNVFYESMDEMYNPKELNDHLENLGYEISEKAGVFKATRKVA